MVAQMKQPWQPSPVQFIQPGGQQRQGMGAQLGQQLLGKAVGGLGGKAAAGALAATPLAPIAPLLGLFANDGTAAVPQMDFGPDPLMLEDGGYISFADMFDGGGAGKSGPKFEGLPIVSEALNQFGVKPYGYEARKNASSAPQTSPRPMARPEASTTPIHTTPYEMEAQPYTTNWGDPTAPTRPQSDMASRYQKYATTAGASGQRVLPYGEWVSTQVSGFNYGTPKVPGYRGGSMGVDPMMYANGVDSVPAMLTPGEAVIPAPAAQDPMNQPAIEGMVDQGRAMNDGMRAPSPMGPQGLAASEPSEAMIIAGPLSGKTQREEMKLKQDMSLKEKAFTAEEKRKNEKHNLAMKQTKMKGALAMKQSQE